jgi:fumarate reductase subunit C
MDGWWRRNPRFLKYVLREGTSVLVALYAVILLCGLTALALGPAWFAGWVGFLRSPFSFALHGVIFVACVFHSITWMQVAPKAAPPMRFGTYKVPDEKIVLGGYGACGAATLVILGAIWWV